MYLCQDLETEEQKNIKFRLLCPKLKEICLYVLMSKTKRNMSLCSYVQNKKEYVFMFLCLKQKRLCHFVLMSETKKIMSFCSYVQN